MVRGLTGGSEDALDLTQECFVAAYLHLKSYDGIRPMRPWLARIAINKCRDWRRRRAVRHLFFRAEPYGDNEAAEVQDDRPTAYQTVAAKDELNRLFAAIDRLPASLREVLILRTLEGLSQADTAVALSISVKAVETRLSRARARLLEFMDRETEGYPVEARKTV